MLDFNLGSIFEGIQHVRDDQERESMAIVAISMLLSAVISFNYSLGMGIQNKGPFLKWMGYCFTHVAGSIFIIASTQTYTKRIIVAAPNDLVKNLGLLNSINVVQIENKK